MLNLYFKSVCLVLSVGFLSACADSKSKGGKPNADGVLVYVYGSENEALRESKNWEVKCRDTAQCPDSVAQMVMVAGPKLGVCTATLIAPDVAITNSHCFDIEPGLAPASICSKGAALIFASASPSGREVVECESVIIKSKIGGEGEKDFSNPDYMVLKLKRSLSRKFETIDTQGLEDGLQVIAKKVNPEGRGVGRLVVDNCEIMHGTFLTPGSDNKLSPVHTMANCTVMSGNSGSSVFDRSGKIRGLVFAGIPEENLKKIEDSLPPKLVRSIKDKKPSFVTNIACVDFNASGKLPVECTERPASAEDSARAKEQELTEKVALEMAQHPRDSRFQYKMIEVKNSRAMKTLVFKPVCYNGDISSIPESATSLQLSIGVWNVDYDFSQRLKLELTANKTNKECSYTLRKQGSQLGIWSSEVFCILAADGSASSTRETWSKCQ